MCIGAAIVISDVIFLDLGMVLDDAANVYPVNAFIASIGTLIPRKQSSQLAALSLVSQSTIIPAMDVAMDVAIATAVATAVATAIVLTMLTIAIIQVTDGACYPYAVITNYKYYCH